MVGSYLSRHQPRSVWGDDDLREQFDRAWDERKTLVIKRDEVKDDVDLKMVDYLGNKYRGGRDGTGR